MPPGVKVLDFTLQENKKSKIFQGLQVRVVPIKQNDLDQETNFYAFLQYRYVVLELKSEVLYNQD